MSQVRERILDAASGLFYRQGIQAVGVDAIIAAAQVARMSFYRHFQSKEGLVLACLEGRDTRFRSWLEAEVARLAPDPAGRPLAVFDALATHVAPSDYRGCPLLNAMIEVADRDDPVYQAASRYKLKLQAYLAGLLAEGAFDGALAPDLLQLLDGAVVAAVREGSAEPVFRARRLAALLLGEGAPGPRKGAARVAEPQPAIPAPVQPLRPWRRL